MSKNILFVLMCHDHKLLDLINLNFAVFLPKSNPLTIAVILLCLLTLPQ
jgi:NADH:ubiquinone oxidoreductase subunit K